MDYYDLLGVKRSASADELKTAYKRQAMKNHPDKGGDPEKFKQINEAYQALSDPQQKQMYDQFGTTDPQQANQQQQYRFHSGTHFDDIFASFGFGPNFNRGFRGARRNPDLSFNYILEFEYIFTGKKDTIQYSLSNGSFEVLEINIPPGIKNGDNIKFTNHGDNSNPNLARGDLIIKIIIKPHPQFRREGNDLYTKIDVTVFDLILGTKKLIKLPNKNNIDLHIPEGTSPNAIFSISDKGIPYMKSTRIGKIFVELTVGTPKLSETDKNIIKEIKEKYN